MDARRRIGYLIFFPVALIASFIIGFVVRGEIPATTGISVSGEYQVTRVLDGDTIEVAGGMRIRYAGIDAPELHERHGTAAYTLNKELVFNRLIRIEISEEKQDLYGRYLGYVYAGDIFVNEKMIEEGYATALMYDKMKKPKYYDEFLEKQNEARQSHRGMWVEEWK